MKYSAGWAEKQRAKHFCFVSRNPPCCVSTSTLLLLITVVLLYCAGDVGSTSFGVLRRHDQKVEERATLDRYHHFHGHSGMCA